MSRPATRGQHGDARRRLEPPLSARRLACRPGDEETVAFVATVDDARAAAGAAVHDVSLLFGGGWEARAAPRSGVWAALLRRVPR